MTISITFLDPVCSSDCPLIAQEFRQAGQLLSAYSRWRTTQTIDVPIQFGSSG